MEQEVYYYLPALFIGCGVVERHLLMAKPTKKQQAMQHDEVTVLLYTFHLSADPTLIQIDKQLF